MRKKSKPTGSMITAKQYQRQRGREITCTVLRWVLVLTGLLFCWGTDFGCARGWIKNARAGENWPLEYVGYGQMMIVASVMLTIAALLVLLFRKRPWLCWIGIGVGTLGITLCLLALYHVASYAADSGFYSNLWDMSAEYVFLIQILPTILPYLCLLILALLQIFSRKDVASEKVAKSTII